MSWQRHLGWVVALMLVGCTFGPAATTVPTLATPAGAESTADALRMAVEDDFPLEALSIRYAIGNEAWQGRTTLEITGSGPILVTFDHRGQHDEWSANLSKEAFLALCQLLVEHQVWDITGQRQTGIPDEVYPEITVQAEGREPLTVGMWHGEALEHAGFGAIMNELAGMALEISNGKAR